MTDKTSYGQSLMHMIKGNLGTGILAMPASFAHTGLINAVLGLPFLCFISTYCVHLLIRSSQKLQNKSKGLNFKYASLAKHSFKIGPRWMRASSGLMSGIVDATLLIAQLGVCCVYIVFVVYNITSILASFRIHIEDKLVFLMIFPVALLLSYIRTLKRLAIASACANVLQAVGISIILEYLVRDIDKVKLEEVDMFRPINEAALGFGSAMFAFEGISVVLPIYTRMKYPEKMSGCLGVTNVSYMVLLVLNFAVGIFGFLRFGHNCRDSITLNLPPEPLYDAVRVIYTISVILTYPLQFYVPNEIIWNWIKKKFLIHKSAVTMIRATEISNTPTFKAIQSESNEKEKAKAETEVGVEMSKIEDKNTTSHLNNEQGQFVHHEYCCRTVLVILTFILAISVPKLNLLMDLTGSITGTTLSLILPAIIHIAAFWDETKGLNKAILVMVDSLIIAFGILAGASGSFFSLISIIESFHN